MLDVIDKWYALNSKFSASRSGISMLCVCQWTCRQISVTANMSWKTSQSRWRWRWRRTKKRKTDHTLLTVAQAGRCCSCSESCSTQRSSGTRFLPSQRPVWSAPAHGGRLTTKSSVHFKQGRVRFSFSWLVAATLVCHLSHSYYLCQGGSVFTCDCLSVCLSVNRINQKLLIKSLWNFTEWLNIIHEILSDRDPA